VAIEQDAAFDGIIEPGEKLHQGGLSGAVFSDQCQHLAGVKGEGEMAHRPSLRARVAKSDVFKFKAVPNRIRETSRIGRRQDFRRHLEK
jgi:hypothetical protein